MDHMRISGTEPSSVILSQAKEFKRIKKMMSYVKTQPINQPTIQPTNVFLSRFFISMVSKKKKLKMCKIYR